MREILFRGKRVNNGEWVEGGIIPLDVDSGYVFIAEPYLSASTLPVYEIVKNHTHLVKPETVGQYTGLTDKNGKKIFEGDVGRYRQTDGAKCNGKQIVCTSKVVYNDKTASFAVDGIDEIGSKNYDYFPIKDFEVIGNIHDNPKLLKGVRE